MEKRTTTYAAHNRRLSVRLNVQPVLLFSFSSSAASSATISWMESGEIKPQGLRDHRTPVLYAMHRSWPDESARRNAFLSVAGGNNEQRCSGSRAWMRACARPVRTRLGLGESSNRRTNLTDVQQRIHASPTRANPLHPRFPQKVMPFPRSLPSL